MKAALLIIDNKISLNEYCNDNENGQMGFTALYHFYAGSDFELQEIDGIGDEINNIGIEEPTYYWPLKEGNSWALPERVLLGIPLYETVFSIHRNDFLKAA